MNFNFYLLYAYWSPFSNILVEKIVQTNLNEYQTAARVKYNDSSCPGKFLMVDSTQPWVTWEEGTLTEQA